MSILVAIVFALSAAETPSTAVASDRYLDCLLLIEEDIETGRRAAQLWAAEGGGVSAQHCLAMADIAAGFEKLGAARLETIAEREDAGDGPARGRLFAQAAEAWLEAGETSFAEAALAAAFEQAPVAADLHLTDANIRIAKKDWHGAIAAIGAAEEAGAVTADGFIDRGRARLAIGDTEGAAVDVVNALSIEPTNIDALTLRGDVQRAGVQIDVTLRKQDTGSQSPTE